VTLLPTGVIALRAAAGSMEPAAILPTTLFASICATAAAIVAAKVLQRRASRGDARMEPPAPVADEEQQDLAVGAYPLWVSLLFLGGLLALIPLTVLYGRAISPWVLPVLMMGFLV